MTRLIYLSGTNGLPGRYGGWDQLLSHLSQFLSQKYDVVVHTSFYDAVPGLTHCDGAAIDIINCQANGFQSIVYDCICMFRATKNGGVCVMLGTSGGLFFPLFRLLGLKIVLNPDGEEWNRAKWPLGVKLYLFISDLVGNIFANVVIADHPKIFYRVSRLRFGNTFFIPYGGNNALSVAFSKSRDIIPPQFTTNSYVFGVCRIEPENNVHLCLEALKILGFPLIFIGNWQRSSYGKSLYQEYSAYDNILLLDPIYDPVLLGSIRSNCNIYFHGHTVGGTNPSLVEALCLGLRVVCHDNEFNRQTSQNCSLYFSGLSDLVSIVNQNYNPLVYKSISQAQHFLLEYSWQSVVHQYFEAISNVL